MFLKYKIMCEINKNDCNYFALQKTLSPNNLDKYMVAVDDLGKDGYIDLESTYNSFVVSKKNIASYVRYKRDFRVSIIDWIIKVGSFVVVIATLILTA